MNKVHIFENDRETVQPEIHVAPSPHVFSTDMATRRMMLDVLIALIPVVSVSIYIFKWYAVKQLLICIGFCAVTEMAVIRLRAKPFNLKDVSVVVTGAILGLSLPATAPWYVGCIGSVAAVGIGKMAFGGLGMNIFNPAMVGRAFVMIAFAGNLAASGYVDSIGGVDAISQATPLTAYKQSGLITPLWSLFTGMTNGSIGETSALACLLGGIYLCRRRTASWQIPAGMLLGALVMGLIADLFASGETWLFLHQLFSGALLFGAFFIATDPVTSPLTARGKWIFGAGIGILVMILRLFSGYPEGVMFAVLIMNAVTPLINRWTIPRPFGGV